MRLMIVIAGLLLAANAMAEEKPKNVTVAKELDKSSPILMSTESSGDSTEATRAKENFDRSKPHAVSPRDAASGMATGKRQHAAAPGADLDQDGRPDVVCARAKGNGVDDDCDGAVDAAPANHNTTRSNRSLQAAPQGGEGGASGGSRAQDYNSSRSNNVNGEADPDSDGDSLEEVRCSMRSDECVDAGNNDPVVRKKPGKR
jgi:hypothetical protein